ncbi:ATP-binding cassette sub-family G member 3 [Cricetulus griseus]|uniref:ATP-binding cassette sub-family G member 3 n=1 Tax=Cricetulus griseus TaxID=10029 RepID=G3I4V7_CRIGR|nr:ATP-binding cassette sub-family G member 3 [Cricetulus griseus]
MPKQGGTCEVREFTELIWAKSSPSPDGIKNSTEFVSFFPDFIKTVRDFMLELKLDRDSIIITEDEYLENALKLIPNDMVMHTVSVRENVEFSAALRLPTSITRDEKRSRINEVLGLLHLDEESNVKPRSKELRKRTSIAMELVIEHPILFLDDPTTDLDLGTTTDVISVLKKMSMRGRTIIFSINQPPYFIFRCFDSLTLLALGKVMFHGPAQEALEYFTSAGYNYDSHLNPVDFFLDIINGGFSAILDTEEGGQKGMPSQGGCYALRVIAVNLSEKHTQSHKA